MTTFLRLLDDKDKQKALTEAIRVGGGNVFEVDPTSFGQVPGAPFAYWVSEAVRGAFSENPAFEGEERTAKQGMATADDFRFVRTWWEILESSNRWLGFAKGGKFSRFYSEISAVVNWGNDGKEICNFFNPKSGKLNSRPQNVGYFRRPGLSWPLRGIRFSTQAVPSDCAFSIAGKMAFAPRHELKTWLAIFNSAPFDYLVRIFAGKVGGVQYEVGLIGGIPVVGTTQEQSSRLSDLAQQGWKHKRNISSTTETAHAFLLPAALRTRLGDYDPPSIEAELADIQAEIDDIAFDLYGFNDEDRAAALGSYGTADEDASDATEDADESDDDDGAEAIDQTDGLLSWAAGVAFGRFDWRLATGEREAPPEPEPFDPLPAISPGMLPDGAEPFYAHSGILVDDQGHPADLARLIEEVLARIEAPVPADVRRWLQRDFFPLHMKQYSKSRRKAPIYWPISTSSGSYTLWLYYPSLTDQTLFTAVNDFIEPKLKQVGQDVAALRTKGSARTRDDEKNFEALQALELELIELRDTLLGVAQTYRPNHDDGVQITAAPLGQLFRHKPWQKILKDTWAKLEKGDYDWAHLAMVYWPDRVREKCEADKSLAIAHNLEDLYVEPEPKPTKSRGLKKVGKE